MWAGASPDLPCPSNGETNGFFSPPPRDSRSPDIQESSSNGGRKEEFSMLCNDGDLQSFWILDISRNKVNFCEFLQIITRLSEHTRQKEEICVTLCVYYCSSGSTVGLGLIFYVVVNLGVV